MVCSASPRADVETMSVYAPGKSLRNRKWPSPPLTVELSNGAVAPCRKTRTAVGGSMRPVNSYPEQRTARTTISHACRLALDSISIGPHLRCSIRGISWIGLWRDDPLSLTSTPEAEPHPAEKHESCGNRDPQHNRHQTGSLENVHDRRQQEAQTDGRVPPPPVSRLKSAHSPM